MAIEFRELSSTVFIDITIVRSITIAPRRTDGDK